jgi:hypothetical protein
MIFLEGKIRSVDVKDERPHDIFPDHPSVFRGRSMLALLSETPLAVSSIC